MSFMRLSPFEQALAACALLAGVDALIKAASVNASILQIVNARYVVGTVLLLVTVGRGGFTGLSRPDVHTALFRGVLFVLSATLFFHALAELPLATAVLLGFTAPIWIAVLAATCLGETPERTVALGIGIAFAGVALVVYGHVDADGAFVANESILALLAGVAAPVIYACATVGFKHRVKSSNFKGTIMVQTAAGAIVSLPVWIIESGPVSPGSLGFLILIGLGATTGQLAYLHALSNSSAARIAATEFTTLPWAFGLGAIFFAETPGGAEILASVLIVGACILARMRSGRAPRAVTGDP